MDLLADLQRLIQDRAADWSDADRDLAVGAALDIGRLLRRATLGDPSPPEEWALVKATVSNLGAGAAVDGAAIFRDWLALAFAAVSKAVL